MAIVAIAMSLPLGATRTDAAGGSCSGVTRSAQVTHIKSPTGRALTAYGVDPANPRRMFVSDGPAIYRSLNGGCTWKKVYSGRTRVSGGTTGVSGQAEVEDAITMIVVAPSWSGRRLVYAVSGPSVSVEPFVDDYRPICQPLRVTTAQPGCAVLVSTDDGATWSDSFAPNPPSVPPVDALELEGFAVAPSDPGIAYLIVGGALTGEVYRTTDAGGTWALQSSVSQSATPRPPLAVDPLDAASVWAGGSEKLMHSIDAGRTWRPLAAAPGAVAGIAVAHQPGAPPTIAIAADAVLRSTNGGGTWAQTPGSPRAVTSVAAGSRPGDLAVTTDPSGPSAGAPFVYRPEKGWSRVPGSYRQTDASADRATPESFYFNDPNIPPGILVYTLGLGTSAGGPDEIQGAAKLGRASLDPVTCYRGPGVGGEPGLPSKGFTPAPRGEGPILVDNFDTGCVVGFDRWGHSKILLRAPQYTEGVALMFDRELLITTRYSNQLTRTRFADASFVVLDENITNVEGPAFDRYGSLYVEDNMHNTVFQYPFPQYPGEDRRLVWSFPPDEFLEDMRIAPPNSPFAGDLLVEYHKVGPSSTTGGNPNAIAVLAPTRHGWKRLPDFATFPPDVTSLGMAFMPDGSLLVADYNGSGKILRYAPDGKSVMLFATAATNRGNYTFAKIDVTAHGYVYVSSVPEGPQAGVNLDPRKGAPVQIVHPTGGRIAVVRFDPSGNRMLPDFTQNLSYPCGIAVPNVITGLPQLFLPRVPRVPPRAGPELPAPPPQPPVAQPGPGPAVAVEPLAVPAPGVGPAGQAQPQANPVSQVQPVAQPVPQLGAVVQEEARAQVAVAHANPPSTQAQSQRDEPMSALPRSPRGSDVPAALFLLCAGTVVLGCAVRTRHARRPQFVAVVSRDASPRLGGRGRPRRRW